MSLFIKSNKRESGFTLIELLLVITILGFMVAMVVPFANHQDKESKIKETNQIFEEIRMATLGARNSFDAEGNRVIGGYVGDVGHLPKLYVYEWDDTNKEWVHPDTIPADGEPDTTANNDPGTPIAGEKNAEPAALWKGTLPGGYAADALKEEGWKGPYMAKPKDRFRDDQVWVYIPSPSTADDFEQNRKFRLREAEGRLSDAWGKAFVIYVEGGAASMDSGNNPLNLVFVSAGPDGRYDCSDPADLTKPYNEDNLVLKIDQNEWDDSEEKTMATRNLLLRIKKAIVGDSPSGTNFGFTGDACRWPRLFNWEEQTATQKYWDDMGGDGAWDAQASGAGNYTKGQPRELWTRKPNSNDAGDDVMEDVKVDVAATPPPSEYHWQHPGIGWRHQYFQTPWGDNESQIIRDAWNREVLFFRVTYNTKPAWLILSRGADGKFDFFNTDTLPAGGDGTNDYLEPADFTETMDLDVNPYDPNGTHNADNIILLLRENDWKPAAFNLLDQITVYDATAGTTKAAFWFGPDHTADRTILTAGGLIDGGDGDGLDDWMIGPSSFSYTPPGDDVSTGIRRLVLWDDTDGDNYVDTGESWYTQIYPFTFGGNITQHDIEVDANADGDPNSPPNVLDLIAAP
ncbi:MAG: prepilin-type N-terminal cleavage/methylation domain-containing protein [Desulfuromonadaceae bacterium]|nr:prepilin-type N-terminal cleavage/methylation domain-containing protein [Desulfuromonadaceae bacterium]